MVPLPHDHALSRLEFLAAKHLAGRAEPALTGTRLQQLGWQAGTQPNQVISHYRWPGRRGWLRCCPEVLRQLDALNEDAYQASLGGAGVLPRQVRMGWYSRAV